MALMKALVRTAVITGLVGGAAVVVAGPDRVFALVSQARDSVHGAIDQNIKDPVALRSQLRSLEAEYPARIGEVRGDLAELRQQMAQLEREREVSEKVVALADNDLSQIQGLIARAEEARGSGSIVRVVFNNDSIKLDDAYGKASHIQQVRETYEGRQAEIDRDLDYLKQQETRLGDLLNQLETERASFQAQMWQLDRQIDAIARNDRLIEVMKDREATIEEHSRYRAGSLEQLTARFSEIRSKQEAQLESLANRQGMTNYEDRAKVELDARRASGNRGGAASPTAPAAPTLIKPSVIEIRPDSTQRGLSPAPAAGKTEADGKSNGIVMGPSTNASVARR